MMTHQVNEPHVRHGFAVVDVETTGLDPLRHRIVEIAVTQVSPSGDVESEWSSLIRPSRSSAGTGPVHVHGITTEDLVNSPTFNQIADQLATRLNGRILVAHNAAFDWSFLAAEAARCGITLPVRERLCTVHLAKQLGLPTQNLRLGTLAQYWGIDSGQAHRAPDDVRVLVAVLKNCLQLASEQGSPLQLDECHTVSRTELARALVRHQSDGVTAQLKRARRFGSNRASAVRKFATARNARRSKF